MHKMRSKLVHVTSMTQAYRAKELLATYRIAATVVSAGQNLSQSGCGYALLIYGDVEAAIAVLKRASIPLVDSN